MTLTTLRVCLALIGKHITQIMSHLIQQLQLRKIFFFHYHFITHKTFIEKFLKQLSIKKKKQDEREEMRLNISMKNTKKII